MSKTNGDGRTVHTLYSKLLGPGAYFAELVWPSLVNGPLGQSNMHSISVQASQEEITCTKPKVLLFYVYTRLQALWAWILEFEMSVHWICEFDPFWTNIFFLQKDRQTDTH